ncbi:MAG: DNA polymerase III subunit gamma and tau [Candidatus Nanopelagicales bacterium]
MALYRTYRPARLDDVVGQDHVTDPLRRALDNDRVAHAYLFSGPRGCGKTSTARILARSLNCEKGPTPDPCGECQSCLDLAANGPGSIDVIELDAASHGGVDDTRDLRERAMFAPAASRYKIYIIDEAHMVTTAGFNALLKLVEEPPEHVRFIFATTEADKVLPTIRSRTHNYTFRLVSARTLQQHLATVCEAEGVPAEPNALALIARAGAGSVRDSLSILSQVISGSGPDGVTYATAVAQLGMTDSTLLDATVDALAAHDGAALFTVIDQVMDAGHDPRRFVTDLLERMRNLIVLQHVSGAAQLGLIDAPEDEISRQVEQSAQFGASELARASDVVSEGLSGLKGATAPRLHLELMAAKLLLPATDTDERGTRARLDQLERRISSGEFHQAAHPGDAPIPAPAAAAPAQATPAIPVPPAAPTIAAAAPAEAAPSSPPKLSDVAPSTKKESTASRPPMKPAEKAAAVEAEIAAAEPVVAPTNQNASLAQLVSMWPAILDATKSYSRVAWMVFSDSAPLSLENGVLAVGVENASKAANAKASGHDERLRQAVLDVFRTDVRIDIVLAPNATARLVNAAPAESREDSSDSPAQNVSVVVEPDSPSIDDENLDDTSGVDLIMRELGGTQIGEIEH